MKKHPYIRSVSFTPTPVAFILTYVSDDEMPDRDDFLNNAAVFATLEAAQKEAAGLANYGEDDNPDPKLAWNKVPFYGSNTGAWETRAANHTFRIRSMPLED